MNCPKCGPTGTSTVSYNGVEVDECKECGRLRDLFVDVALMIFDVREVVMPLLAEALPEWLSLELSGTRLKGEASSTDALSEKLYFDLQKLGCYPWILQVKYVGSGKVYTYTNQGGENGKKRSRGRSEAQA